jgi:predicted RNA binding protein YcfA (HicA-like mRNA interferase family)
MSPKLPSVSGEETVRVLKRLGFVPIRQPGNDEVSGA